MSSSSNSSGSKGGEWSVNLRFWKDDKKEWKPIPADKLLQYFRDVLTAEEEIIIFSEIRKYDLWPIPGWFGNWHEYTIVKTTNWYWSFEKMVEGIFVQRSKNEVDVRRKFAGENRKYKDRSEGRSSKVSFGENMMSVAEWIINRDELGNKYLIFEQNCHYFASLLYEAITRTVEGRRLSTTF